MSNMHKPNATEESITDDFDIVDESRLSTSLLFHENKPCKGDSKPLMINTGSLPNHECKYEEDCSYELMIHKADHRILRFVKMLKRRTLASYVFIICAVILLYQAPVIFYYAAISPDIDSSDITDYVDFKRCSVKVFTQNMYTILKFCTYIFCVIIS